MDKSDNIAALAAALCKAQANIRAAEMNATNPFLKNRYADLGSIIEAARPVLASNGLSFSQLVGGSDGNVSVTTVFMHESGEWLAETVSLPIGDDKGRSLAQNAGAIITYLRRYSLAAGLGIYADEDTDGSERKPQPAQQEHQQVQRPTNGNRGTTRPLAPADLADMLNKKALTYTNRTASQAQRGLVAGVIGNIFLGDDDNRHTLQEYLFGSTSLNDCADTMILAALDWLKPTKDSGGAYQPDPMAEREAHAVISEALKAEGQADLGF